MFRFPCSYSAATAFLAVALLTKPVDAQSNDVHSANQILPACQKFLAATDPGSAVRQGECAGIIEGLSYMADLLPPDRSSCRPQAVIHGQMIRVVVAYIERRPQRMHESFKRLALEALHDAWPCKR